MPSQVVDVYNGVITTLLENNGFGTLGIMSDAIFFSYLQDVLQDFYTRTGVARKLFNIEALAFLPTYAEPDNMLDVQAAFYDRNYLYRSSGWYLDNFNAEWFSDVSIPERWREDELSPKTIQLAPQPSVDGYGVATNPATPGYGQIAATSNAVDFDLIAVTGAGYGAINGANGNLPASTNGVYLEAINAGFGTVAQMVSSTGNLEAVATAQPTSYPQTLAAYFQLLPDSALPYIKYGVLEKIYTVDGEYKNNQAAMYCRARYSEGVNLFSAIMTEAGMENTNA